MVDQSLPQLETTALAQHCGIDVGALRDALESLGDDGFEDELLQIEAAEPEKTKRRYRNMQHKHLGAELGLESRIAN